MVDDCSPQVLPAVDADNPLSNGPSNHIDNTYLLVAKHLLDNIPEAFSFVVVVVENLKVEDAKVHVEENVFEVDQNREKHVFRGQQNERRGCSERPRCPQTNCSPYFFGSPTTHKLPDVLQRLPETCDVAQRYPLAAKQRSR